MGIIVLDLKAVSGRELLGKAWRVRDVLLE
jgi:hypothetical protein